MTAAGKLDRIRNIPWNEDGYGYLEISTWIYH